MPVTRANRNRVGPRRRRSAGWVFAALCLLAPIAAQGQESAVDNLPGAPRSPGVSLSPEAPPTPPAPGGRAPSFGASDDPDAWVFRIGGRISGWGQMGFGHKRPGQDGIAVHTPPLTVGRSPFYAGPGGTLNFQYGNQTVTAFVSLEAQLAGQQWQGYHRSELGPRIRT